MATKVGEFFVSLAVDAASGELSVNDLVSALGKLDVVSVGTVGILSKVTSALWGMGKAAAASAVEMSVLKDVAGSDPKMVQQWEKAAQRINIEAGTIKRAILGVNAMMGAVATGRQHIPMELSRLGVTPYKVDAKSGKTVAKDFEDIMREIAKPTNPYWGYSRQAQQDLIGPALNGADPASMFRLLNEMKAGKFHPERISVLENNQVKELTETSRKSTEVGQQFLGILDKFLIVGGTLSGILDAISDKLTVIDAALSSKYGQAAIGSVKTNLESGIRNLGNPLAPFMQMYDVGKYLANTFQAPRLARSAPGASEMTGKLDINIHGLNGGPRRARAFLGTKVTNSDVEQITINAGNGGLGQ